MNCPSWKVPPVYIVLFKGDSSDFTGNQEIIVKIDTQLSLTGCKAHFRFLDFEQDFNEIPSSKELSIVFPKDKTAKFPLGAMDATLTLEDSTGRIRTASNRIHIVVTNSVNEAYNNEDPQSITVVVSGGKVKWSDISEKPIGSSDVFDMECSDWDFRKVVAKLWKSFSGSVINED